MPIVKHTFIILSTSISMLFFLTQYSAGTEAAIARCSRTGIFAVATADRLSTAGAKAVTNCIVKGGEQVCCRVLIDTEDSICIALALSDDDDQGTGSGETRAEAKQNALKECGEGCRIVAAPCSK